MYTPAAHPDFSIRRLAPSESGAEWSAAVAGFDPAAAEVLKRDGDTAVYRTKLVGRPVVLKCWELRGFGARLKAMARASRADRHWRGAQWLLNEGLATAELYALVEDRRAGRLWLAMEALPGKTVLQHLVDGDLTVRQEHAVARGLGRMVLRMVGGGRWNRDSKPSNLIVTDRREGNIRVATIDCVAIRPLGRRKGREALRMYASLLIEPLGVGHPPRRTLACRFLTSAVGASFDHLTGGVPREVLQGWAATTRQTKMWKSLWRQVSTAVLAHGDPTPRVNPIAPPAAAAKP